MIWIYDYSFVFYAGSFMAITSLAMALNMPRSPAPGNEVLVGKI
jgi:hypothetical protein